MGTLGRFITLFAACLLTVWLLPGCAALSETPASTAPSVSESVPQTTAPLQDNSLTMLRQTMAASPELFAVAYLGNLDEPAEEILPWILENNPKLLGSYPFLANIPQGSILGRTGEIYCIIPRDKDATVLVTQMIWNANHDFVPGKLLYRSESGSPFILLCNSSDYGLDTQITITAPKGDTVSWCPGIDDSFTISLPYGSGSVPLAWDISLYEAGPRDIYHSWYQDGWYLPYMEDLEGTQWTFTGTGPDGREAQCFLILNQNGTASLSWQYADTPTQEYYHGSWSAWLEHRAFLKLDLQRTGGVLHKSDASIADSFAVLLSPEGDRLLLGFSYYGSVLPLDPVEKDVLALFEAVKRNT